ncbi:MAG TPA: S41 family peptidase [Longimicrobium sp.]
MPTFLRRRAPLLLAALLLAACESPNAPAEVPGTDVRMSRGAREYLDSALAIMQNHSLHRHEVDWEKLRREAYARASGAELPAQTYNTINTLLKTLNRHSFLIPPSGTLGGGGAPSIWPLLGAAHLEGRFGYVRTSTHTGSPDNHVQDYHDLIRDVDAQGTCGWVVDLRFNPGGNMWPMLAGVGPILGEGSPGAFIDSDGVRMPWYYAGGVAGVEIGTQRQAAARAARPYRLRREAPPVAVLTGTHTASAAEAVAIAFRGRPDARSFGLMTDGVPTANQGFAMPDDALLVLTTAWEADRNGVIYKTALVPDETIIGNITQNPNPVVDDTLARALEWLGAHPACQPS